MLIYIGGESLFNASTWADDGDPNEIGAAGLWSAWQASDHIWGEEDPNGTWGGLAPTWGDDPDITPPITSGVTWASMWGITNRLIEYKDASIHHMIEERSTAKVRVLDIASAHMYYSGQEIIIHDEEMNVLFGGIIVESIATKLSYVTTPSGLEHSITASDYHLLAEHRYFNDSYVTPTPHEVINDILGVLVEEGITEGEIQEGVAIENQLYPYVTCAEALNSICQRAGFVWWISEEKKLYAVVRTTYNAAWNITNGSKILKSGLSLTSSNPDYRNVQYISGGQATTSIKTATIAGDGVSKSFPLGFPLASAPTATLNGATQTWGIKGVDTGKHWYWSAGDSVIYQDDAGTALNGTSDRLIVDYVGNYRLIAKVDQQAEITRNQTLQGFGTGMIENIYVDASILNQNSAIQASQKMLLAYAAQGLKLYYTTNTPGLACGVIQTVTLPEFSLVAQQFLIYSIDIKFKPGPDGTELVFYSVSACQGPVDPSWGKIICGIADLAKASAISNVSENDSIQGLTSFTKTWLAGDTPNPFISVIEDVLPSDTNFPCLAWVDIFPYLVVYVAGVEYYRKPVVSTIQTTSTQIDTIGLLLAQECNNVSISHVGLWGGVDCTNVAGSGIELEKQVYVKTKTVLESLQFNFTDTKGW